MAFPTTPILDNFNRPDENPLSGGGAWISPLISGSESLSLVSNEIKRLTTDWGGSLYDTLYSPDQEIYITITNIVGDSKISLYLRLQKPTTPLDGYTLDYFHNLNLARFTRRDAGVIVQLGSLVTLTLQVGDVLGLRIQGTTLEGFVNGNSIGSRVDSVLGSSGYLAVEAGNTSFTLDNFGGGVIGTGLPSPRHDRISIPIGVLL